MFIHWQSKLSTLMLKIISIGQSLHFWCWLTERLARGMRVRASLHDPGLLCSLGWITLAVKMFISVYTKTIVKLGQPQCSITPLETWADLARRIEISSISSCKHQSIWPGLVWTSLFLLFSVLAHAQLIVSMGPESQLILVTDNFHCTCYCWSSEPKGKEKNDFHNIVMGYWILMTYAWTL